MKKHFDKLVRSIVQTRPKFLGFGEQGSKEEDRNDSVADEDDVPEGMASNHGSRPFAVQRRYSLKDVQGECLLLESLHSSTLPPYCLP